MANDTLFKTTYVAGETAKAAVTAPDAVSVVAVVGADTVTMTRDSGGAWVARVPTAAMIGKVRWSIMATQADGSVECLAQGAFIVTCAGRSPLWDVVEKIDEAVKTWGTNPNRSISVGEIRIDYKSLDDLLSVRAEYVQRAEAQECGRALTGGLRVVEVKFA